MKEKKDILANTPEELEQKLVQKGYPKYRGEQIYRWLHQKGAVSFHGMTNLPRALQDELAKEYEIPALTLEKRQQSSRDGTNKFLFRLADNHFIESVWLPYVHGNSVCISAQVGCAYGCRFCASGITGLTRNLSVGEMLGQVYRIQAIIGQRVSHVVVMGMGEPLDNYSTFVSFVRQISQSQGLQISQRNITASTCGLAPQIRKLAKEHLQITLALSLHGTTNEKRRVLMPITNTYPLEEVLDACEEYFTLTGRRVTYEYSLVAGVNDGEEELRELTELLRGKICHVNLIPINPINERKFLPSNPETAIKFKKNLEKCGINVTIRREMGTDIDGACGQLRLRKRRGALRARVEAVSFLK